MVKAFIQEQVVAMEAGVRSKYQPEIDALRKLVAEQQATIEELEA